MAPKWVLAAGMAAILLSAGRVAVGASCREEAGEARAALYVRECLAITSATHPPCNAENSCADIGQHVQYMCAHDPKPPAWCLAYKDNPVPNPPPPMESAAKPGFDCAKASSPVERAICGSDALAGDDRDMTELYLHLLARTADKDGLRAGQREFNAERRHCADPEPGRSPEAITLDHCIDGLTRLRIAELKRLAGKADGNGWTVTPDPCEASFGEDGSDQINVQPAVGKTEFDGFDMREAVLAPSDKVAFDVDGTAFSAMLEITGDGQANAVSTDPRLIAALGRGRWLRVKRNGKIIFRADLAGFSASCAKRPGP